MKNPEILNIAKLTAIGVCPCPQKTLVTLVCEYDAERKTVPLDSHVLPSSVQQAIQKDIDHNQATSFYR